MSDHLKAESRGTTAKGGGGSATATPTRGPGKRRRRQGAVLVVVIVCVMVAAVVFTSIVKLAAAQRRMIDRQSWQMQASWLAESGLERAAWRLAADANYPGETWILPADQLAGPDGAIVKIQGAVVKIEVETVPELPNRRLVRVRADYPDHPQHRSRQSKQAVVQLQL